MRPAVQAVHSDKDMRLCNDSKWYRISSSSSSWEGD